MISRKVFAVLLFVLGMSTALFLAGVHYNVSRSMPAGLYCLASGRPVVGDLVTFDLPDCAFRPLAVRRGYPCRNLLKKLVAVSGDQIKISAEGIAVNGVLQPFSRALKTDSAGRTLPVYLNSGVLPEGRALVLSGFCVDSFDGRYFGTVSEQSLRRVVPLITFNDWSSYDRNDRQ
jgi:conjugative transfer signal peptidase TraF